MVDYSTIDSVKFADEDQAVQQLLPKANLTKAEQSSIDTRAEALVVIARGLASRKGMMESFLEEFGLSNKEGLALMCLAESLLRVPDADTADRLIAEKIATGNWEDHKGHSDNWLVNASTWGLMLTGSLVEVEPAAQRDIGRFVKSMTLKMGEPVIRRAMIQAMKIMGEQFVLGRTIEAAVKRANGALCSFDMLGEGARTIADAERYFLAYAHAIDTLAAQTNTKIPPHKKHGISVKLSALHPRYEPMRAEQLTAELYPKLKVLAQKAAAANINLTLDAEESERLIISLQLLDKLARDPDLSDWNGLGLAVQAYQKRALEVLSGLKTLAADSGKQIMVRLVKGAYWDTEIKNSQINGDPDYPVWTRKENTDLSYLACARFMLGAGAGFYCQFATHNAHSAAAISHMIASSEYSHPYEFQRLHGMGEALYKALAKESPEGAAAPNCRIYAPVGAHEDLLPYLVRRLLENGANTSFVHAFLDDSVPAKTVAASPFAILEYHRHSQIPLPRNIYENARLGGRGLDLSQAATFEKLGAAAQALNPIHAWPIVDGHPRANEGTPCRSPFDDAQIGSCVSANDDDINTAYQSACAGFADWDRDGQRRAKILLAMADGLEKQTEYFAALMAKEAGKIAADAIFEIREAVDFLRYYAAGAQKDFTGAASLPSPAGETNHYSLHGRGVFACISPWNFPLAIFIGQIAAALAAGNTVLAKPAPQTPLTAFAAVQLFHKCGLPSNVLHLLPGGGETGAAITALPGLAGVCFTGSTHTARAINQSLAAKDGPIPVLIAETGGLNAMVVDTSALKEQVTDDVVASAFNAAGQRCSALRLLFLPAETADSIIECIGGAMDMLEIGDPARPTTDIGPVIDRGAQERLNAHIGAMQAQQKLLHQCALPPECRDGSFIAPTLVEISDLDAITEEQFGPILHVIRYRRKDLLRMARELADKNYALTLGIHTRIDGFAKEVIQNIPAGNIYINRNIIGAVVGVQPFGGHGLSGTGPKAGGPRYLHRFATERVVTDNIAAKGGDPALLNLE